MFKRVVGSVLSRFGYQIQRVGAAGPEVRPANFHDLALAYEGRLAELGQALRPNERRSRLLGRLLGTPPAEAYYLVKGLSDTAGLAGDVCEFGVAQGETSALIANEIIDDGKRLHLFDSFEGLPKPTDRDQLKDDIFSLGSIEAYAGTMACPEDMVRARLAAIGFPAGRFAVHKGFIEALDLRGADMPAAVSFAYVDFDFYEPIRLALEFLDEVAVPGAVVVVDDYDYFSTGAKSAVDEFVAAANRDGERWSRFVPDPRYGRFAVLARSPAATAAR